MLFTPAQTKEAAEFHAEFEGTGQFWSTNRHIAKRHGGKFLRGINENLRIIAAFEDELGNFFCLTELRQRIQFDRDEVLCK